MYSQQELMALRPESFPNSLLSEDEIMEILKSCNAVWFHDSDPKKPHIRLSNRECSNGYFNAREALKFPPVCIIMAQQMLKKLCFFPEVEWVVGSACSGITISYEYARLVGAKHGFAEKDSLNPDRMIWKGLRIESHEKVLQVEDVVSTGDTFKKVRIAIQNEYPTDVSFLPVVACLVHRPKLLVSHYGYISVCPLVEREVWAVERKYCPLCERGSEPLDPKKDWQKLTRR